MAKAVRLQPQTRGAQPAASSDSFLWDRLVPQLAERRRGASKTWIVQFRRDGQTHRRTLGSPADMPVEIARGLAQAVMAETEGAASGLRPDLTLVEFGPIFLTDCTHLWKPSTLKTNRSYLLRHISPVVGKIPVASLTRDEVLRFRNGLTLAEASKTRVIAVLSLLLRHAEIRGLRPPSSNPCTGVRKKRSDFVAEYLDPAGYASLGAVLRRCEDSLTRAVAFVRFIALTGCRKGEALAARWDHLDRNRLALPDSKTGPKAIWLGLAARRVLAALPRVGSGIFSADDPRPLLRELDLLWPEVRTDLGRPGFRLHDLRHSFASVAVNQGLSLKTIGGMLGHSDVATTEGYAHLDLGAVTAASERVGRHLGRAFALSSQTRKHPSRAISGADCAAFMASGQSLAEFCAAGGFTSRAFQRALRTWHRAQRRASA